MRGLTVACLEIILFFIVSYTIRLNTIRLNTNSLQNINSIMYYWFCFTVLTGFWEFIFVTHYHKIAKYANSLVHTDSTVWNKQYPWYCIMPNLFAQIFYAEYGANADREYKSIKKGDFWSRLIESSHALCCSSFCLASLISLSYNKEIAVRLGMVGMGMQFMNSLLYMGEYFEQCRTPFSVNYNSSRFPLGEMMCKRWFMWINIFWLVFPEVIITQYTFPHLDEIIQY